MGFAAFAGQRYLHPETLKKNDQDVKTPAAFRSMIPNDYIITYSAPEVLMTSNRNSKLAS